MFFLAKEAFAGLLLATAAFAAPISPRADLTLIQQLLLSPTSASRLSLLSDTDFKFNFNDTTLHGAGTPGVTSGRGGRLVSANAATFPILLKQGGAMSVGFIGPCGFNTPHLHPRATEMLIVTQGRLNSTLTTENGGRHVTSLLNTLEMAVYPIGSMHAQYNPDCEPAMLVAAFTAEDPGTAQIAQEYFGLEGEVVRGSAGGGVQIEGANVEAFRGKIPGNVVLGVESCLKKCGIAKR
ncbi:RmlC-like cupin domain-containing protein [Rhexocercosporidium sp. MPI-PUGE-AT-0058]|nr:RmlC-like cupin domain-containing protein [Rhexocercosporidium sp. MPI-PUGE-AT-0058]